MPLKKKLNHVNWITVIPKCQWQLNFKVKRKENVGSPPQIRPPRNQKKLGTVKNICDGRQKKSSDHLYVRIRSVRDFMEVRAHSTYTSKLNTMVVIRQIEKSWLDSYLLHTVMARCTKNLILSTLTYHQALFRKLHNGKEFWVSLVKEMSWDKYRSNCIKSVKLLSKTSK